MTRKPSTESISCPLARQAADAQTVAAATLGMSGIVAGYVDQTSEEMVTAYAGFRLSHRQAVAAQAVALAAESAPPPVVTFGQVAPVAMMLGSADLLRAWVPATLAGLAADDEYHARLRDTLLVSSRPGGATRRRPSGRCCTRIRSNTGSARPRKASVGQWPRTATTWNSRCRLAAGSAPAVLQRPESDWQPKLESAGPGSVAVSLRCRSAQIPLS